MDTKRILRPNPNFEEDLERATIMEDHDWERVLSYPRVKIKKLEEPKHPHCKCEEVVARRGAAPVIELSCGKEMPALALGTWLGADASGMIPVTDHSVYNAVKWAIDAGYRHIDTAAIYDTETQVGLAINEKIAEGVITREEIFVTTKLWNNAHARDAVVPALRNSLRKLNLTYVDLYLIHWPTPQSDDGTHVDIDYLETWKGMQEAKNQGLTKTIGVSNFNKQQLKRLIYLSTEKPAVLQIEIVGTQEVQNQGLTKTIGVSNINKQQLKRLIYLSTEKPAVLQIELNLNLQQSELRDLCCYHKIAVMAYTPFGSLFHSRAARDAPPPRTHERRLVAMSDKYKKTVAQIALRYLVELGVVPIPKSLQKERIEANIQVYDFELTPEEHQLLKGYDVGYRTIAPEFLKDSPYYPFEKKGNS